MNIKKIAAILAVLSMTVQNVSAQINKISCDYETGECRVQGSFPNVSSKNAAAAVLKPGKTVDDDDAYAYTGEIPIDGDGKFDASFMLGSDSGEYMLRIGTDGQIFEKSFVFLSSSDIEKYLKEVNAAKSAAELEQVFEKDYQRFKNICAVTIRPSDKEFVYNSLFEQIPSGGFKSFDDLKYMIAQVVLLNDFMTETEQPIQKLEKLFEYFDDKYLPVIDIWNNTSLADDSIKKSICGGLKNKGIDTIEKLEKEFYEQTVVQALNAAVKSARGKELAIVKEVHSLLGVSQYGYFESLGEDKQISVLKSISAQSYTSTYNYAKGFDDAVNNYKNNLNRDNNGGGTSGGSTGGGGGFVYVPDAKNNQKNEDENSKDFSDLEDYEWAKPSIERLAGSDVISGRGNGIFDPGSNVKREEFTSIVIKALGLYDENAVCDNFLDVKPENWFYKAVGSAAASGIINGISDTEFGTGQNVTRQDAVLICKRAAEKLGISFESGGGATHTSFEYAADDAPSFADWDSVSDYARDAVTAMQKSGIVTGKSNNEFKPADNMTRAEAAVVVDRLMKLIETAKANDNQKDLQMVETLKALGLYNGDEKGLTSELTRGEAADLLCSLLGITKNNVSEYTFSDCKENNQYAKAVYAVTDKGYLKGVDKEFGTDYSLDYNDAVRAAVIALGAGAVLEHSDNDTEYMRIASERKLLDDVKRTSGGYITKCDFLKLFYNMLDENIYLMEINGGVTSYSESKDETFLSHYHRIYKKSGKVTANSRAGISGESSCGKGRIKINGTEFSITNADYSDYIGRETDCYYKDRGDEDYELVYMIQRNKTNIITLDSRQIKDFKNLQYKYRVSDNAKEKTLDITSKVNVIYNTKNIYDYTDSQLVPKSGTVTFVDADGDGRYTEADTIIIKDYKNIVVGGANKSKNIIYDKYYPNEEDGYTVDLNKINEYTIKDKHGDSYGLSELREWDVLAALISPDKEYAEFTLVDEAYAGNINSIYDGGDIGDKEISIDSNTYKFSKDWRGDLSFVKPGKKVTVYWDLFGNVAAVRDGIDANALTADNQDESELSERIVILTMAKYDPEKEQNFIRSYYSDNKFTTNYISKNVKVNGKGYKGADILPLLDNQYGKAVIVRTDSQGEVKELVTAAMPGEDSYRGFWQINYPGENMLYKGDTKTFGNRFIAGDNIYTVPMNSDDYQYSSMFAYNNASFRTDSSYTVDAYTTSENGIRADAVVYKAARNATASYDDDTGYVISDIKTGLNEDDEPVMMIDGYSYDYIAGTATAVSYEVKNDAVVVDVESNIRNDISIKDIQVGDCIRFGLDNGKISTIMIAYDYSENKAAGNTTRSGYTYAGYAYSMSDDQGYLSVALGKHPETLDINSYENGGKYINSFWIRNGSLVTVVDKTGTSTVVRNGSMSDILTYKAAGNSCSKIVLFSSWQSFITGIVVYAE